MKRMLLMACLGLVLFLATSSVKADPWPALNASAGTLSFVHVTATQGPANVWSFALSVDGSAPIAAAPAGGIKALAVYLNNGNQGPDLEAAVPGWGMTAGVTTIANWGFNGGYERPKGVFGTLTGSPVNYIHKGESSNPLLTADFNGTGFNLNLNKTKYLVHLDWGFFVPAINGNTAWYTPNGNGTPPPPEIPEPATMLLLGSGLLGAAGFARIRRKK